MKGVLFLKKQETDVAENALTALARMTLDDLLDLVVQKIVKELDAGGTPTLPPYVTTDEAAGILRLGKRTFENLVNEGKVPGPVLGGGSGSKRIWRTEELLNLKRSA